MNRTSFIFFVKKKGGTYLVSTISVQFIVYVYRKGLKILRFFDFQKRKASLI